MECAVSDPVSAIYERLVAKVGQQRFKIWFKNSTQFSLADGFLKIGVPNSFIGGWIENHFAETIGEAVREVLGRDVHLTFSIDPALSGSVRQSQLNYQADFIAKTADRAVRTQRRLGRPPTPRPLRGRLEDFVVGTSNRLAFSAAQTVVETPGGQFHPLFVHGGCGLGKTHLLQGIANALRDGHPKFKLRYLSGEEFTNQFIFAVRSSGLDRFRNRYRQMDALVIDDIHFLANKKATQEEFLHTFNAIDAVGCQVVMASDTHPKLIGQLSPSLVNRFVSGMVVKIEPPDLELRCEILRRKAARMGRRLDEGVIRYIAENLEANVRELEGALLKLAAFSTVSHQPITVSLAQQALADHLTRTERLVHVSEIENVTATFFGLTPADLHSSRKTRTVALARGIAMYLARKHTQMSFPEIGRFMGNKNHSTVILACRKLKGIVDNDGPACWQTPMGPKQMRLRAIIDRLEEALGGVSSR